MCASQNWRNWSGYFVAGSYDLVHDYEYHAIRNTAGLIDVSPLFKYDVRGRDALRLVDRVITRNAGRCAVGQALYTCLCDDDGKVLQDGTVFRLEADHFRLHLAEPSMRWLTLNALGMDVEVCDVSEEVAALALQGPNALAILRDHVDVDLASLRFFRFVKCHLDAIPALVSRTGYTGDLGYEIWLSPADAERAWDALVTAGKLHGIKPAGILALDLARLEAGFILLEVDYIGADKAWNDEQRYSPFEIGLGWTVDLSKDFFVGSRALRAETQRGSRRQIVGLEIDWRRYEELYRAVGLPAQVPAPPWRGGVPVYTDSRQVGHATTGGWSPILKKYVALATLERNKTGAGTRVELEATVQYARKKVPATVVKLPFFDPPRKRSLFK
ncbi:MAG TPA: aminomethyltransferase family protein [Candidatus Eisenbacteria bacterium]|nr:aminomethyltransferase family protein [Candidatus Eisenbacteria bacterium]